MVQQYLYTNCWTTKKSCINFCGKPKRDKVKMPKVKRDGSMAGGYIGYLYCSRRKNWFEVEICLIKYLLYE